VPADPIVPQILVLLVWIGGFCGALAFAGAVAAAFGGRFDDSD
jgi:hypothetical protein